VYITLGSPWENPYIESFHDKFRDECLNAHVFEGGRHAQGVVEAWRIAYNEERPHSSLNYMTPAEYAGHWRNSGQPTASLHCANAPVPGPTPKPRQILSLGLVHKSGAGQGQQHALTKDAA
jgi:hypothetical protein